jgi:hypothetical protein
VIKLPITHSTVTVKEDAGNGAETTTKSLPPKMISIKRAMENGVTPPYKIPVKPETTAKKKPSVLTTVKQDGEVTEQFDPFLSVSYFVLIDKSKSKLNLQKLTKVLIKLMKLMKNSTNCKFSQRYLFRLVIYKLYYEKNSHFIFCHRFCLCA